MRDLDAQCSRYFTYRDLIECGKTWMELSHTPSAVVNIPEREETWDGLAAVAANVLDPIVDAFGRPKLTYCFSCAKLGRKIRRRIAPALDQHAGAELNTAGRRICERGGQAVDLWVPGRSSADVAGWVAEHVSFDRLYFYGPTRPFHVSWRQNGLGAVVLLLPRGSREVPRVIPRADAAQALRAWPLVGRASTE